ncbi:MAG: hypothetical protein OXL36_14335 [Bryobacterales bacterium]|nr:hypothetical protein [Bryobacterales bacterium]MDE0293701.1 hypothetical protein [Bryobacterales bacterium]
MKNNTDVDINFDAEQLFQDMIKTAKDAVDETMEEAVDHAKKNHPRWRRQTGRTDRNTQVIEKAKPTGFKVEGTWGVVKTPYAGVLRKRGDWLAAAQNEKAPGLSDKLERKWHQRKRTQSK